MSILKGVKGQIDVKVTAEFDSASGSVRVPFVAVYRRRSAVELGDLSETLKRQNIAEYVDLIRDCVVGWRNLEGNDGSSLPFSTEALDEMVNVPEYLTALIEGLGEAIGNRKALSRKN
jgi:hypothetical protein